jgi:hypothetical protein
MCIIEYIAYQIGLKTKSLHISNWNSRISREHNTLIRKYFKFSIMGKKEIEDLKTWLWEFQFPFKESYIQLSTVTYKRLYDLSIEPVSSAQMKRYLRSWSHQFESEFFDKGANVLSIDDKIILDNLLKEINTDGITLNELKQDPSKASVNTIEIEINRLNYVQKTSILSSEFFQNISPTLVKKYHNYVMSLSPSQLESYVESRPNKKYTLLACFCYVRGVRFIDNLTDILLKLVHKISTKGKKRAMAEFWHDRRIIYNKDKVLHNIAVISVEHPQGIIEEEIYPKVGKEVLDHIASNPICFDEYYTQRKYYYMSLSYKNHYRRMLILILNNLELSSNNIKNNKIFKAVRLVKKYLDSKIIYYPTEENIPNIISHGVEKVVIENGKLIK